MGARERREEVVKGHAIEHVDHRHANTQWDTSEYLLYCRRFGDDRRPRECDLAQYRSFGSHRSTSIWTVVCVMWKRCSMFWTTVRTTCCPSRMLPSATTAWQLQAMTPGPTIHTWRSCTSSTLDTALIVAITADISVPGGVPSRRTVTLSRKTR